MGDITLSFDNGPDPAVTPGVLNVLAGEDLEAVFFVLGHKIATPEGARLMHRAKDAGHRIGNHTYTHEVPLGRDPRPEAPEVEIARTEALIGDLAGDPPLFRPFGGGGQLGPHLLSAAARDHLAAGGYTVVTWNAVPRDWEDPAGWVDTALEQVADLDHALLVLHDLPTGAMDHLPRFLDAARAAGHRFRADFPSECTPMISGVAQPALSPYIAHDPGA